MQGLVPQPSQLIDELLTLSPKDRAIALSIPLAEVSRCLGSDRASIFVQRF